MGLAARDMRIIRAYAKELEKSGFRPRRNPWWSTRYSPVLHWCRLWWSIRVLADLRTHSQSEDLGQMRQKFANLCEGAPRVCLAPGPARKIQRKCVKSLFHHRLGLALTPIQVVAFSRYAESTVLVGDFLNYCEELPLTRQADPRRRMRRALPEFASILRAEMRHDRSTLPPMQAFTQARKPMAILISPMVHPRRSMIEGYEPFRTLVDSPAYQRAESWVLTALDNHFRNLDDHFESMTESESLNLRIVLAWEMHLRSCELLCCIAWKVSTTEPFAVIAPQLFSSSLQRLDATLLQRIAANKVLMPDKHGLDR